jgi:hypothetical protein
LEIILLKAQTGYKGPAIWMGLFRELNIGYKGGQLITAHRTRIYIHERAKSPEPVEILSGLSRPSGHDVGMETPLTFGEIDSFAGDDDDDGLTGDTMPVSVATGLTGSSNVGPQGEENAAIAEVGDLVVIPEIAIGTQNGPEFAGSETAVGYAPFACDEPVVNDDLISATRKTSLDLAEKQLIEPSVSDVLFELPRAFDMANVPEGLFDRPRGDESGSIAENVFMDFTRPPAGTTSSTSLANTDNDFVRPEHVS